MEATRGDGKFATAKGGQKGGPILLMVVVVAVVVVVVVAVVFGLEERCYLSLEIILFSEVVIF